MKLALFDLDNTLLRGDSDHAWGEFLIEQGIVDAATHAKENDRFYRQYQLGKLDIDEYVRFTLNPVIGLPLSELDGLHRQFMESHIEPIILKQAVDLVEAHKAQGDFCIIISATNTFITTPIAERFSVDLLIGTELEVINEKFTGAIAGIPCIQDGKVKKLTAWLKTQRSDPQLSSVALAESTFYSDSINDLPLLLQVAEPVVVDGDESLKAKARNRGWRQISLREPPL